MLTTFPQDTIPENQDTLELTQKKALAILNNAATGAVPLVVNTNGVAGTFTENISVVNAGGNIPAGVKKYSFAVLSGTVTLQGAAIPVGAVINGGGFGQTLAAAIPYTILGGSVLLQYEN